MTTLRNSAVTFVLALLVVAVIITDVYAVPRNTSSTRATERYNPSTNNHTLHPFCKRCGDIRADTSGCLPCGGGQLFLIAPCRRTGRAFARPMPPAEVEYYGFFCKVDSPVSIMLPYDDIRGTEWRPSRAMQSYEAQRLHLSKLIEVNSSGADTSYLVVTYHPTAPGTVPVYWGLYGYDGKIVRHLAIYFRVEE